MPIIVAWSCPPGNARSFYIRFAKITVPGLQPGNPLDYNVLRYQVFSRLLFKPDLASKMYCIKKRPGLPVPKMAAVASTAGLAEPNSLPSGK